MHLSNTNADVLFATIIHYTRPGLSASSCTPSPKGWPISPVINVQMLQPAVSAPVSYLSGAAVVPTAAASLAAVPAPHGSTTLLIPLSNPCPLSPCAHTHLPWCHLGGPREQYCRTILAGLEPLLLAQESAVLSSFVLLQLYVLKAHL
ncbi:hypothetical protein SERLA73DRAFT_77535 [Serpula lacrymans var. lacrymans S7.3]|uniref:Uncharacterized protein n=2 Tax=Serpula lacrymans var. lacrymans TaxID=341189 RepID=F8QAK6_SERL3|nr:uncharacterized protein SERLADRAFT_442434 [Serpula lacrymans var. lacrymans S7.9]EGN94796.1 hypothetical protein SERLA73DRAFT_77535 [Serpula lacrymans var. lacrymans S7.3]EGO20296.1 hypothetical protein SERLADRAFT_442434 [Serpula lacrymans var. lacrymans S7.9]